MVAEVTNKALGKHAGLDKFIASVFELNPRGKSSWIKEGTGPEHGTPAQYLKSSKTLYLEPSSRLFLGKGNGYMPTQYVIGANTHYVNNYYEDKNGELVLERAESVNPEVAKAKGYTFRPGLKSQGYDLKEEYRKTMEKGLCFEMGRLDVGTYGEDPILLKFIQEHEQNDSAPRAGDNRDPKRLKLFQFSPSIPELKAANSNNVQRFDDDFDAMQLVATTRTKKPNGTYVYQESRLNAILAIIDDGRSLREGEVLQKFDLVAQWSRKDGTEFVRLVKGAMDDVKMDIALAEQFKVISFTAKNVRYMDGGGKEIMAVSSDKKEDIAEDLMLYLIGTPEGQMEYAEIGRRVEVAKLAAM